MSIGDDQDVTLFAAKTGGEPVPGLPKLNSKRVVSDSQIVLFNLCSQICRSMQPKALKS